MKRIIVLIFCVFLIFIIGAYILISSFIEKGELASQGVVISAGPSTATGFATQLRFSDYQNTNNLTYDAFIKTVDYISNLKLKNPIIRFTAPADDMFPRTDINTSRIDCSNQNPINCSPTNLNKVTDAIKYAKSKNVKVFLVTYVPYFARTYSDVPATDASWSKKYNITTYLNVASQAYSIMLDKFGNNIDVWNIFNESNAYAFDSHKQIDNLSTNDYAKYLNTLFIIDEKIIQVIKDHKNFKNTASITTDVAGLLSTNDSTYVNWKSFLNKITPKLNLISFNVYPGKDDALINDLPNRLKSINSEYKKQIGISEIGLSSKNATEAEQGKYISFTIEQLAKANPFSIIVYEYQDDSLGWMDEIAKNYGAIKKADGITNKLTYDYVISALGQSFKTPRPQSKISSCTFTYLERFEQTDGTSLDKKNWGDIFSKNFTVTNKSLTLNKGDYISSPWVLSGNFDLNFKTGSILPIKSLANGEWSSLSINLTDSGDFNKKAYSFIILREGFGFTLILRDPNGSFSEKKYYAGTSFDLYKNFSISRVSNNLIVRISDNEIGMVQEFIFKNVSSNDLKYNLVLEGSANAQFSVSISQVGLNSGCRVSK